MYNPLYVDKPMVGITEEKIGLVVLPLLLKHTIDFLAVSGVTVILS